MRSLLRLFSIAILSFVLLPHADGQTSSAAISGHLVDQSGGVVPNAEVDLVNQQTNVKLSVRSNGGGDFIFPDVQPGTFTVIVHGQGYKELHQVDLVLSASQNLSTGTLVLHVGAVTETVTVSAAITPLQTDSAERSAVLDNAQMENLLAIGRDAMALTRLAPGVIGGEGSASLGTATTPTVNGVNNQYNLVTVDGVPGNTRGGATFDTPPNMDAIQEVTLLESSYSAANGKVAGANINFVTKNGTSRFHGGLYYYFRNEDLNANAYFNKFNGANIARPRYRYNTYGGTLGGPIFWPGHFNSSRNKLFFFVSLENSPIRTPDGTKFFRIPTQMELNGDFSQTYQTNQSTNKPLFIRNPALSGACTATGGGPACFTNNKVPVTSGQGQTLLQILYNNTIAAHPGNYIANNPSLTLNNYNYTTNNSSDKSYQQQIVRVDYDPTAKLHLYSHVSQATINNNGYGSTTNKYTWLFPVNYQLTEPSYSLDLTYTFTPTIVNEFTFGASAWNEYSKYDPANIAKVQLGASGFNLPSLYAGVNPLNLFPSVSFGGVSGVSGDIPSYGWDSRFPFNDNVLNLSFTDGLTKVSGPHAYKFGVDFETDTYLQTNHNRVGTFAFDQNSTNPNDTNFAYSNALLGNLYTYSQVTQLLSYDPRTTVLDFYAQDTWKVNSHLTLDYGMRTSYSLAQKLLQGNNFVPSLYSPSAAPALYQFNSGGTSTDPTTGTSNYPKAYAGLFVPNTGNPNNGILYVNTPGYPSGTSYNQGLFWQPRFGFAYALDDKTVIRGHYGVFYNARSGSGQEGDLTNNAPSTNSPTQYYSSINSTASNYYASGGVSNLNGPFSIGHALPFHMPLPYTTETSIGVQRAIPFGAVIDIAYVGSTTQHSSRYVPINEVPYGAEFLYANQSPAGGALPDNFFRPYPGFGTINMQQDDLSANYNALQARITRRLHNGLEFGAVYTYSRTMDYGTCSATSCSDSYNFSSALYQNVRKWNYGPASYDIKHNLALNYLWALPKVSRLWDNFATRSVLDGWQISGIVTYLSGAPEQIALAISGNPNITGGGDGARIVQTCDPMHNAPKTFTAWFNTSCLSTVTPGAVGTAANPTGKQYSFPNGGVFSPKADFFLPGDTNFDTALFKNMPLNEKGMKLQLRVETYNTFNHSEFNQVNATTSYSSAGVQSNSQLGQFTAAANPRYMQLALRLDF